MEQIQNIGLFVTLSWLLIISPGPDSIFVLTKGISGGKKAGLISAFGVTLGILVHTTFAAFGLSVILQTSAMAFVIIKYAGAAYLIFLGIQALLKNQQVETQRNTPTSSRKTLYNAVLTNVLNPKVGLFFIAFLPQFISPKIETGTAFPFVLLGGTFAVFTFLFLALLALLSAKLGKWFLEKSIAGKYLQKITGLVFIALGLRLALADRN
ncbi:MAG: LysE family translocator [Cyclobacteriaceae bacterium]